MLVLLSEPIDLEDNLEIFFAKLKARILLCCQELKQNDPVVKRWSFFLGCDIDDLPVYAERLARLMQELSQPERTRLVFTVRGVQGTFELQMDGINLVAHLIQ